MKYGKAESSISPSTIPRNSSLEMSIPATAVIIFADGKEFYDPSVMRVLFQYRVSPHWPSALPAFGHDDHVLVRHDMSRHREVIFAATCIALPPSLLTR